MLGWRLVVLVQVGGRLAGVGSHLIVVQLSLLLLVVLVMMVRAMLLGVGASVRVWC